PLIPPRVIISVTERGLLAALRWVPPSAPVLRCRGWGAGILIASADTASIPSITRCTDTPPLRSATTVGQLSEVRQPGRHTVCASTHLETSPTFMTLAGLRRRGRIRVSVAPSNRRAHFGHCCQWNGAMGLVRRARAAGVERKLPALRYIA